MSEGPHQWLYTSADYQAPVLTRTPVVSYPFGAQPSEEHDALNTSVGSGRISVEDPRITHTRPGASTQDPADFRGHDGEQQDIDKATGQGHAVDSAESNSVESVDTPDVSVEPLPQAHALALVRKHIFSGTSEAPPTAAGRLKAERFSVGWVVRAPDTGAERHPTVYYVTDDGELERTSSVAASSTYLESVEKRFRQRQALFG